MQPEILAKVIRGETVESVHRGHLIVVDGRGQTIESFGDPGTVTFFRSAAKAFQAIPFITSGAADRFGFSEPEMALACASHSGERFHTELAAGMLARGGFDETDLKCGAHLPFHEETAEEMIRAGEKPTQIHNNCSGKHAAMLAFAKHIGADTATYDLPENPIQRAILKCVADFTEVPEGEIKIGIDGCAAPNFALPIRAMARSFARLVNLPESVDEKTRSAAGRVIAAKIRYPELIGGTQRLDTVIMRAGGGRLISKVGAEGVYLAGILPSDRWETGLGIAFKIEDGEDKRARPVVAVELLRRLGVLDRRDLADISPMLIHNRRGDVVGRVVPAF
ncbi:MAG: asparaginase [Pyrinomonadaceae bacterium]